MALPTSGQLTLADIQTEFGGTNPISLSEYYAGGGLVPSGTSGTYGAVPSSGTISIQNFYGTTNRVALSVTYSSNTADASLNLSGIGGYIAGFSDITVTVNSGVYLYANSTGNAGLAISGGTTGDTLNIVNNGFIIGRGGNGYIFPSTAATSGGPALSLSINTTINNTNGSAYIAGGGGGGANQTSSYEGGGGGGAGGGNGGAGKNGAGGAGGGLGGTGTNGTASTSVTGGAGGGSGGGGGGQSGNAKGTTVYGSGGGGGGRILPGTGGAGGVASAGPTRANGGAGGTANAVGGNGTSTGGGGGGGGGWGASGGLGSASRGTPGSGGSAVQLNGKSVTWVSGDTTRVYGAVS